MFDELEPPPPDVPEFLANLTYTGGASITSDHHTVAFHDRVREELQTPNELSQAWDQSMGLPTFALGYGDRLQLGIATFIWWGSVDATVRLAGPVYATGVWGMAGNQLVLQYPFVQNTRVGAAAGVYYKRHTHGTHFPEARTTTSDVIGARGIFNVDLDPVRLRVRLIGEVGYQPEYREPTATIGLVMAVPSFRLAAPDWPR